MMIRRKLLSIVLLFISCLSLISCSEVTNLEKEITSAFSKKFSESVDLGTVELMKNYGKYKSYNIVLLKSNYLCNENSQETIVNLKFHYGICQRLFIYNNGELYGLKEAYLNRLLNNNDLSKIYDKYKAYDEEITVDNAVELGFPIQLELKEFETHTIDEDFASDVIMIVTDKNFNKYKFEIEDFDGVDIKELNCLTEYAFEKNKYELPEDFHHIYKIIINNPSKQNILNTIEKLKELDFVKSASPSMNYGELL